MIGNERSLSRTGRVRIVSRYQPISLGCGMSRAPIIWEILDILAWFFRTKKYTIWNIMRLRSWICKMRVIKHCPSCKAVLPVIDRLSSSRSGWSHEKTAVLQSGTTTSLLSRYIFEQSAQCMHQMCKFPGFRFQISVFRFQKSVWSSNLASGTTWTAEVAWRGGPRTKNQRVHVRFLHQQHIRW